MFDRVTYFIKTHSGQIAIFAITTTILAGIALLTTGDISTALAGRHKH